MVPRLKTLYEKDIVKNLMNKLNYKNKHQAPKLVKIVLNMGLGEDASDGKKIKTSIDDLSLISGQKPVITKFKKSIANFKTIEIKGLEFNPFNKKWKKSDNLSVNYIICSSKI